MAVAIPLRRPARRTRAIARLRPTRTRARATVDRARLSMVAGAGVAFGGALGWFMDPQSGAQRRHVLVDRTAAFFRRGSRKAERAARHAASDAYGVTQRVAHPRSAQQPPPDDVTLARKVETELFRDADVPKGQININAENGRVILRGEVPSPDLIKRLESQAARIPGVEEVENLLHTPGTPVPQHAARGT